MFYKTETWIFAKHKDNWTKYCETTETRLWPSDFLEKQQFVQQSESFP